MEGRCADGGIAKRMNELLRRKHPRVQGGETRGGETQIACTPVLSTGLILSLSTWASHMQTLQAQDGGTSDRAAGRFIELTDRGFILSTELHAWDVLVLQAATEHHRLHAYRQQFIPQLWKLKSRSKMPPVFLPKLTS